MEVFQYYFIMRKSKRKKEPGAASEEFMIYPTGRKRKGRGVKRNQQTGYSLYGTEVKRRKGRRNKKRRVSQT